MAYEDSDYPGAIDTFRTQENIPGQTYDGAKTTTIFKEDFEKRSNAILALENALGTLLENVYPVGIIVEFAATVSNPSTLGMPGTWARHCEGEYHASYKASDPNFGTIDDEVGSLEHTHSLSDDAWAQVTQGSGGVIVSRRIPIGTSYNESYRMNGTAGTPGTNQPNGTPLDGDTDSTETIPPTKVMCCWQRTA